MRLILLLVLTLAAAPVAHAQSSEVDITLDQFGVGNFYRAGEPAAAQFTLISNVTEPIAVQAVWEMKNADGDVVELVRTIPGLSPGQPRSIWMYAQLPPDINDVWIVRIFQDNDGKRGRELGALRFTPSDNYAKSVPENLGMIGIVARGRSLTMGLESYAPLGAAAPGGPSSSEQTVLNINLTPSSLPDRWEGLYSYEAIVWSGDIQADPQSLSRDAADALKDYVSRGGHLIICLPSAGNPWNLGSDINASHLNEMLPQQAPKSDSATVEELLPILARDNLQLKKNRLDIEVSMRVFKEIDGEFNAIDNHYEPLVALQDGRVVVISRTWGFGAVTVIGVDLSGQLNAIGLPQADAFWNRILGRRCDTPSVSERRSLDEDYLLNKGITNRKPLATGPIFSSKVDMSTQTAVHIMIVLLLFGGYFAATIGSYLALRSFNRVKYSWQAFAGVAALFTFLAWGGAPLVSPNVTRIKHVTFLDHISHLPGDQRDDEPQLQRAVSWLSLHLPKYGLTHLSIDAQDNERNLLMSWEPAGIGSTRYPNPDRYQIDIRNNPADYEIPTRSTASRFALHYMGGVDPDWGTLPSLSVTGDGARFDWDKGWFTDNVSIRHSLPAPLEDVHIVLISPKRTLPRRYEVDFRGIQRDRLAGLRHPMLNVGHMFSPENRTWEPGTELRVPASPSAPSALTTQINALSEQYMPSGTFDLGSDSITLREFQDDIVRMLSIYHQLDPPEYRTFQTRGGTDTVQFTRSMAREVDLSRWFRRPCLIIMGYMSGEHSPIPLRIEGDKPQEVDPDSLTFIRWIIPLPPDEQEIRLNGREEEEEGGSAEEPQPLETNP